MFGGAHIRTCLVGKEFLGNKTTAKRCWVDLDSPLKRKDILNHILDVTPAWAGVKEQSQIAKSSLIFWVRYQ